MEYATEFDAVMNKYIVYRERPNGEKLVILFCENQEEANRMVVLMNRRLYD